MIKNLQNYASAVLLDGPPSKQGLQGIYTVDSVRNVIDLFHRKDKACKQVDLSKL